ncbi:hypothetical protein IDG74_19685 [Escherichia coli]|uniref:Uncharacterized protein n=2 Tax=Enterobacteriaceae TaxID=543 RepID=A0A7H9KGL9_9ESCH|nr:hypothetical protein C1192_19645 [Escherichia marmotae]AXV13980.1 hypothetical protein CHI19_05985 [Escherichia coli]ELL40198.1 hypothetical protein B185_020116 [Escherichia coli J96]MBB2299887.1 hypothetical protein [Escherichia sp. 93.1447]MBB2402126.1 hypothetical protein [Escherichia sp. 14.0993]MBB2415827.1 hypothetical protein [Escherichia sp. 11.1596]MBB2419483.1 hypothetical protein [Escherichia sp. 12.2610]MBB2434079.1 hypothetical protein [Escherichia sp. 11.1600]PSY63967.1 hyp
MPPVITKSVMHYSITYALHSFMENASQKWGYAQDNGRVDSKFCVGFMKGEERWAVMFHRPIQH